MKYMVSIGVILTSLLTLAPAAPAQELRFEFDPGHFRFDRDDRRANEGKRAACEVYAQTAVIQARANQRFNCGFSGGRWDLDARPHFRWCRFVPREAKLHEQIERSRELQQCFDRLGDFDEGR
jgi:hypothetical protein